MADAACFPSTNETLETYAATRRRIARLKVPGGDALEGVLRTLAREVAEALQVTRVGVWFLVDEGRQLSIFVLHTRATDEDLGGALVSVASFPTYFECLDKGGLVDVDDVTTDPRTAELREPYCEPLGIGALLDAPIVTDGRMIGVVCHEHLGGPRAWTQRDKDFVAAVAVTVAAKVVEAARADAESALQDLQAHLGEQRQMALLGRMAAGIAHDLNNLLTIVQGNAELIVTAPEATPELRELGDEIQATARRGRDLARELLELGRQRPSSPRVVHVGAHVERFATTIRRGLGREWTVEVTCAGRGGRVLVDPQALERIVLNLVVNARDATPGGGTIVVDVSDVSVPDARGVHGSYVLVRITDTGRGMSPETRARVFEPFFTTKTGGAAGAGHGLGLAIVYDLVERAGGFIHVDSELGRGTSVRVYLPRLA